MKRSDLIAQLAERRGINLTIAETVVHEIFASMTQTLIAGNRIEIRGFGTFEIREYESYSGRNPKTGLEVVVKPKKAPFFKTGKELKERILESGK